MSVLVAYDDSDPGEQALEYALDNHADEQVTVLHAINPVDPDGEGEMILAGGTDYRDRVRERAQELLDSARERAEAAGVDVDTELVVGAPDREIVAYATDNDVDHVVIGSHGRRGVTRVLLGSVAENVVRRSPVPVTVVR